MDPDYACELLRYTQPGAVIARMQAWRKRFGLPKGGTTKAWRTTPSRCFAGAVPRVRAAIRDLLDALGTDQRRSIHLCGNAQRLSPRSNRNWGSWPLTPGLSGGLRPIP